MGTIGGVLTSGIKDIASLLPLLGTEQCEDQVGSALTKGRIYAAATPLSIFGSLGLARAGLKALIAACVVPGKWNILGARILDDLGFKPQGTSLPLIMFDTGKDKNQQYLVERQLDELNLLKGLHVDIHTLKRITVTCPKSAEWNASMMLLTFISCLLSITPYVYINISGNSTLSRQARWTFPIVRAIGGFLTTTMMQLVIQNRVITLTKKWLSQRIDSTITSKDAAAQSDQHQPQADVEGGTDAAFRDQNSFFTWCWLALLLGGILAIAVGYVGCFSIVQSARTYTGPLSWLFTEIGLSAIRMILWGRSRDDAPPLEIVFPLEKHAPLPTCMKFEDEIKKDKVLPLTSAPEFLKSITSFVGPTVVEQFSHPDLTLYYTMTRPIAPDPKTSADRVLYITITHQKEKTTWVYDGRHFYSTTSEIPDPDYNEITLDEQVEHTYNYPVDANTQSMLERHHRDILTGIKIVTSDGSTNRDFTITTKWTLQEKDTTPSDAPTMTDKSKDPSFGDDCRFIGQARLERKRKLLMDIRRQWVEDYMKWVTEESLPIGKDPILRKMDPKVGKCEISGIGESTDGDLEKDATGFILMSERYHMEMLLVGEVRRWEQKLLHEMQQLSDDLNGILVKKHLVSAWSRNCRRRLSAEMAAMDERMSAVKKCSGVLAESWAEKHQRIRREWKSVLNVYVGTHGSRSLPQPSHSSTSVKRHLENELKDTTRLAWHRLNLSEGTRNRCQRRQQEMEVRLTKEAEDIEMRLERGLEKCDQLCTDYALFQFRHSHLKWRALTGKPLKRYADDIGRASDVTHITCSCSDQADVRWIFEKIQAMSLITSIDLSMEFTPVVHAQDLIPFIENNRHLLSITGIDDTDIEDVLNRNLESNSTRTVISPLSRGISFKFGYLSYSRGDFAKISFFGPSSGKVILRLEHYSECPNTTVHILQGQNRDLPLEKVPKRCWTIDEITLHSRRTESDHHDSISFEPGMRNELTLRCKIDKNFGGFQYRIRDIQVLPHPSP